MMASRHDFLWFSMDSHGFLWVLYGFPVILYGLWWVSVSFGGVLYDSVRILSHFVPFCGHFLAFPVVLYVSGVIFWTISVRPELGVYSGSRFGAKNRGSSASRMSYLLRCIPECNSVRFGVYELHTQDFVCILASRIVTFCGSYSVTFQCVPTWSVWIPMDSYGIVWRPVMIVWIFFSFENFFFIFVFLFCFFVFVCIFALFEPWCFVCWWFFLFWWRIFFSLMMIDDWLMMASRHSWWREFFFHWLIIDWSLIDLFFVLIDDWSLILIDFGRCLHVVFCRVVMFVVMFGRCNLVDSGPNWGFPEFPIFGVLGS